MCRTNDDLRSFLGLRVHKALCARVIPSYLLANMTRREEKVAASSFKAFSSFLSFIIVSDTMLFSVSYFVFRLVKANSAVWKKKKKRLKPSSHQKKEKKETMCSSLEIYSKLHSVKEISHNCSRPSSLSIYGHFKGCVRSEMCSSTFLLFIMHLIIVHCLTYLTSVPVCWLLGQF